METEPKYDMERGAWSVPTGYRHPQCDVCKRVFHHKKPQPYATFLFTCALCRSSAIVDGCESED